jgi:serine/threonine-protein kinase
MEQLSRVLGDRYEVQREIGRGGMATVYLANDRKHQRQVAVKVLRPELELGGPDRFVREVGIAAQLSHPHILALYDSGSADGVLFYVMPFIKGESLRQRLDRERQLPVDVAVGIARQVAFALGYAHAQGVIHRDIKPENILLHEGEPMIADFGIALAMAAASGARLTESGLAVGTPEYMSPEQAFGEQDPDGRSDVYSLASVLFELLAGEPPYTGPTAMSVLTKRSVDPVPSVRRLRATVPAGIEKVLMRALAKSPADRFPSAAAFAEALSAPGAAGPSSPVVAVLPFLNLSPDPDNEYFVDGITEDVIIHLSKVRTLDVISRSSVMPFKRRTQGLREIAATLNAGSVLDGSVRRAGNRVRIVAQLIDAATEQHLWGETYDRELTDIFAIQTDVALQIVAALRAELTPDERTRLAQEPTADLHAYQLYLQGRHCFVRFTAEGLTQGIRFLEEALVSDPGFALAHAGIALAWVERGESGGVEPGVAYAKAKAAVTRAIAIDPDLADAQCALGYLKTVAEHDWVGAEQAFKRALALQPGHADACDHYGRMCGSLGRFDEAVALARRAHQLDPLAHRSDVANALLRAGRFDEALDAALRVIEFDPHYDRGHATLGWALQRAGRTDEGIAALRRAVELSPENSQWLGQLGQALGMAGRADEARGILAQLGTMAATRYVSPYHFAYVHTGLGEHDAAIDLLERAQAERAGAVYGIRGSFLFTSLREHPRFVALLRKMQLV